MEHGNVEYITNNVSGLLCRPEPLGRFVALRENGVFVSLRSIGVNSANVVDFTAAYNNKKIGW